MLFSQTSLGVLDHSAARKYSTWWQFNGTLHIYTFGSIVPSQLHQTAPSIEQNTAPASRRICLVTFQINYCLRTQTSTIDHRTHTQPFLLHHIARDSRFVAPPFFTYIQKENTAVPPSATNLPPCATRTGMSSSTPRAARCRSRSSRRHVTPCRLAVAVGPRVAMVCLRHSMSLRGSIRLQVSGLVMTDIHCPRCCPDAASHLFRAGHPGRKTLQHFLALVDAAGSCRLAGHAGSGRQGALAGQDRRGWSHYCVSFLRRPCMYLMYLLTICRAEPSCIRTIAPGRKSFVSRRDAPTALLKQCSKRLLTSTSRRNERRARRPYCHP